VVAPVVTFGLTVAVIAACLVGFGDTHRAKPTPGQALGASADHVPLPTPLGAPITAFVHKDIAPDTLLPQVVSVTTPQVVTHTTTPLSSTQFSALERTMVSHERTITTQLKERQRRRILVTHPTPTTTVTTVVTPLSATVTVTTVTTVTVHLPASSRTGPKHHSGPTNPSAGPSQPTPTLPSHHLGSGGSSSGTTGSGSSGGSSGSSSPTTTTTTIVSHPTTTTTTTSVTTPPTTIITPTTTTTTATTTTTTTATPPPGSNNTAPTSLQQGVYVGAADPDGIAAFDAATHTQTPIASDYLQNYNGWNGLDGADGQLSWMFAGGWTGTPYTLSLGVPIIPRDPNGNSLGTLAAGAAGNYNAIFTTLAQTLIAAGESNAYLRLGYEFDGTGSAWAADTPTDEANFARYFQQIVTTMRAVPGEHFRFVWNPDAAAFMPSNYNVELAYPGSAYVDDIGLDAYDATWIANPTPTTAWNETTLAALNLAEQFASAQGKPLAIPEWGLVSSTDGEHGLGDDPLFINNFTAWMKNPANHVDYESYFNISGGGNSDSITDGAFPNGLAALAADLG
jgi:beta-mannanase